MAEKRIPFDRPQPETLNDATQYIIYDKEQLMDGYERVYTSCSIVDIDSAPTRIRFATGDQTRPIIHEDEPNPVANVYYNTEREYHCRMQNLAMFILEGGTLNDKLVAVWHGYDKKIGEK